MEMTDDKDNNEKDNAPKELEKDSKENIIPLKAFYNKQLAHKSVRLALFPSGNAVILHHADVNTPPPDITG